MPRAVRRRMTLAVALVRGAQETLARRQILEGAMLSLAPSILDRACDLATDIASPAPDRAREISASVRACISTQTTDGLRGDVSGIDAVLDETSRSICVRQLPLIDRVHLLAAIVQGVEDGLRDLLTETASNERPRDGPSSPRGAPASARTKTTTKRPHVAVLDPKPSTTATFTPNASRDAHGVGASEAAGSAAMTPDYDDV